MIVEEVLFDRMVCAEATPEQWRQLEALAVRDPAVWRRLAHALEDHGTIVQAVSAAGDLADAVPLPGRRAVGWSRTSGWMAAAAVAALWAGTSVFAPPPPPPPRAPPPAEVTAAEVVQELPSVLVSTKELPEGVEVTYVRRTVERRTARSLFEETTDEWGEPAMVPADILPTPHQEL